MTGAKLQSSLLLVLLSLLRVLRPAHADACYKHLECTSCIAEVFDEGGCMWYVRPGNKDYGICIAGIPKGGAARFGEGVPITESRSQFLTQAPDGTQASFTVFDVDTLSENSCYVTECQKNAQCDQYFYPVINKPCYDDVYPEYRRLKCCRRQRNFDGFLVGVETTGGIVQGDLFFGSCCANCFPGTASTGCGTYSKGTCETCPVGQYKEVITGRSCLKCEPCPPGKYRFDCGGSKAGLCRDCPVDTFKVAGLEGSWADQCLACDRSCGPRWFPKKLTGCGLAEPGRCESCPSGRWYAQPFCRDCSSCPNGATRSGCGGSQEGVCSRCAHGWYMVRVKNQMKESNYCYKCPICPDGFVRVGCGGWAAGECVQVGTAELEGNHENCHSTADAVAAESNSTEHATAKALCPGTILTVGWTVSSDNAEQAPRILTGLGNCTEADGRCLAGLWRATLFQRTPRSPDGYMVRQLQDWWPLELETAPVSGASNSSLRARMQLRALPANLGGGAGYFLRVSYVDFGGSCCGASGTEGEPLLTADSADFAVRDLQARAEAAIELASLDIFTGARSTAVKRLTAVCGISRENTKGQLGSDDASVDLAALAELACEKEKSLRLGQPVGEKMAFAPPLIVHDMREPAIARQEVFGGLQQARSALADWEMLASLVAKELALPISTPSHRPEIPSDTQAGDESNPSNRTFSSDDSGTIDDLAEDEGEGEGDAQEESSGRRLYTQDVPTPLHKLLNLSLDVKSQADMLGTMWEAEVSPARSYLERTLSDLKAMGRVLEDMADASGFNLIRFRQDVVRNLWELLENEPEEKDRPAWFEKAMHSIGNAALMLLGSWDDTWYHDLKWRIVAEVGDLGTWPLEAKRNGGEQIFGGVPPPAEHLRSPLEDVRARMWDPLSDVADAWMERWRKEEQDIANAHGNTASINAASLDFSVASELSSVLSVFLPYVQSLTEDFLLPLARAGSEVLRGPLPNLTAEPRGEHLSMAIKTFAHEVATEDVWYGLGLTVMRPWISADAERARLTRVGEDIVSLVRSRVMLFENVALQLVDVHGLRLESWIARRVVAKSEALIDKFHFTQGNFDEPWRWQQFWELFHDTLLLGRTSATRLSLRRLHMLEQMALWLGTSSEAAAPVWRSSWRVPVNTPVSAAAIETSEAAADTEFRRALHDIQQSQKEERETGFLRVEINSYTHPLAYEGLKQNGQFLFQLQAPASGYLRMHAELHAFIISPELEWEPLTPRDSEDIIGKLPNASEVKDFGRHVEIQVMHVSGSSAGPPHDVDPFVSRHARSTCTPLENAGAHEESDEVRAALLPMDGLWVLTARDGKSGLPVVIDDGTFLRLMFKFNVPQGIPPWRLLKDKRDALYNMPQTGDCLNLETVFGKPVAYASTSGLPTVEEDQFTYPTQTPKNVTTTYLKIAPSATKVTTTSASEIKVSTSFLEPAYQNHQDAEEEGIDLISWAIPASLVGFLVCCGIASFAFFKHKQRKIRKQSKISATENAEDDTAKDDVVKRPAEAPPTWQGQPAGISPAWCPAPVKPRKEKTSPVQDTEDWATTDTPRAMGPGTGDEDGNGSDSDDSVISSETDSSDYSSNTSRSIPSSASAGDLKSDFRSPAAEPASNQRHGSSSSSSSSCQDSKWPQPASLPKAPGAMPGLPPLPVGTLPAVLELSGRQAAGIAAPSNAKTNSLGGAADYQSQGTKMGQAQPSVAAGAAPPPPPALAHAPLASLPPPPAARLPLLTSSLPPPPPAVLPLAPPRPPSIEPEVLLPSQATLPPLPTVLAPSGQTPIETVAVTASQAGREQRYDIGSKPHMEEAADEPAALPASQAKSWPSLVGEECDLGSKPRIAESVTTIREEAALPVVQATLGLPLDSEEHSDTGNTPQIGENASKRGEHAHVLPLPLAPPGPALVEPAALPALQAKSCPSLDAGELEVCSKQEIRGSDTTTKEEAQTLPLAPPRSASLEPVEPVAMPMSQATSGHSLSREVTLAQNKAEKAMTVATVLDEVAEQATGAAQIEKAEEVVAAVDGFTASKAFDDTDHNKDGMLDGQELVEAQATLRASASSEVAPAIQSCKDLDSNCDGLVSQEEFDKEIGKNYLREKADADATDLVAAVAEVAHQKTKNETEEAKQLAATLKATELSEAQSTPPPPSPPSPPLAPFLNASVPTPPPMPPALLEAQHGVEGLEGSDEGYDSGFEED